MAIFDRMKTHATDSERYNVTAVTSSGAVSSQTGSDIRKHNVLCVVKAALVIGSFFAFSRHLAPKIIS